MAVERDVKPRNINLAKVQKRGRGGINREGAFIRINTVLHYFRQPSTMRKSSESFTSWFGNLSLFYIHSLQLIFKNLCYKLNCFYFSTCHDTFIKYESR